MSPTYGRNSWCQVTSAARRVVTWRWLGSRANAGSHSYGCHHSLNGTVGENKVLHVGKIWPRIAVEVAIRIASESINQISTTMVGLKPFRQLNQGDINCYMLRNHRLRCTALYLSIGAISQVPPAQRDDWCTRTETVTWTHAGTSSGGGMVKTHVRSILASV